MRDRIENKARAVSSSAKEIQQKVGRHELAALSLAFAPAANVKAMIFFVTMRGLEAGLRPLQADPAAPQIELLRYDDILGRPTLPRGTYIFTDFEGLSAAALAEAARLYRHLQEKGCRTLNDPARACSRFALLRRLHQEGVNSHNAYLVEERKRPSRFPVFIRTAHDHRGALSELIWEQSELDSAIEAALIAGYPRSGILIVEYAAEQVSPGVFRKSSLYKVGDHLIPDVWWFGTSWHVKGDRDGLAEAAFYKEELQMMRENRFAEDLAGAFSIVDIDYGRLDFGLVNSKPCIYEINTYPILFGPRPDPIPERATAIKLRWERLIAAFRELDSPDSSAQELVDVAGVSLSALKRANEISQALRFRYLRLSREHLRRGELSEALAAAEAEVAANPDNVKALSHLSRTLKKCGRADDAITVATRVVQLSPRRTSERLHLAKLLLEVARYDLARDILIEGLRLAEDDWNFHRLLAAAFVNTGDEASAVASLHRAAELAPDSVSKAECLSQVLNVMMKQGERDGAIAVAIQVIEFDPERKNDRFRLINLLRETGRFQDARTQLLDGLAVHGEQWRLYFLLSHVNRKLDDLEAALEAAAGAVALAPDEVSAADWLRRLQDEASNRHQGLFNRLAKATIAGRGLGRRLFSSFSRRPETESDRNPDAALSVKGPAIEERD